MPTPAPAPPDAGGGRRTEGAARPVRRRLRALRHVARWSPCCATTPSSRCRRTPCGCEGAGRHRRAGCSGPASAAGARACCRPRPTAARPSASTGSTPTGGTRRGGSRSWRSQAAGSSSITNFLDPDLFPAFGLPTHLELVDAEPRAGSPPPAAADPSQVRRITSSTRRDDQPGRCSDQQLPSTPAPVGTSRMEHPAAPGRPTAAGPARRPGPGRDAPERRAAAMLDTVTPVAQSSTTWHSVVDPALLWYDDLRVGLIDAPRAQSGAASFAPHVRRTSRSSASSPPSPTPSSAGKPGEVVVHIRGGTETYMAYCRHRPARAGRGAGHRPAVGPDRGGNAVH